MSSPTRSCEAALTRDKAQRLGDSALAEEITRCRYGMGAAANKTAATRFERRLLIMVEEQERRSVRGGAR